MGLDRRSFLRGGAAFAAWTASALATPLEALAAADGRRSPGYGPLAPVRDGVTGLPLLQLPPHFRYFSFGWAGDPMIDGRPTPPGHDGAAAFAAPGGRIHYVRNHELHLHPRIPLRASFAPPERTWDAGEAPGGVTTATFDPRRPTATRTEARLSGTLRNCAGGPTPWGTWLSCEETLDGPDDSSEDARLERTHGWVFEVAPTGPVRPEPIPGLGRMWHEAVAVDPATRILYLTEDRPRSGLYRFVPDGPAALGGLARGGRLEMLAIEGEPLLETGKRLPAGRWVDVRWVPIRDPERPHEDPKLRDGRGLLSQGLEGGGATFRRGEGAWFGDGRVFFVATSGGAAGAGQIFELDPGGSRGAGRDRLRLVFESAGPHELDRPDNLVVSPRGTLLLCEDAEEHRPFMRGLTREGAVFDLARNHVVLDGERNGLRGDFRHMEFAGACFSPDGRWLLASIQWPGISFAITGPWERGPL